VTAFSAQISQCDGVTGRIAYVSQQGIRSASDTAGCRFHLKPMLGHQPRLLSGLKMLGAADDHALAFAERADNLDHAPVGRADFDRDALGFVGHFGQAPYMRSMSSRYACQGDRPIALRRASSWAGSSTPP